MPNQLFRDNFRTFYREKEIQKSYKFFVSMFSNNTNSPENFEFKQTYRINPIQSGYIKDWHVLNIQLPNYDFKKEVFMYGILPRTFPVLETDGFELSITFEEDEKGTIAYLVNWLQSRIFREPGIYEYPAFNKVDQIICRVVNEENEDVVAYIFERCYFLRAENVSMDYSSNESVKYSITFGTDYYKSIFSNQRYANNGEIDRNTL